MLNLRTRKKILPPHQHGDRQRNREHQVVLVFGSFGDFIKTSGERRPGRAPCATPEAMAETRHKRKGTPGHAEPFLPSAARGAERISTGGPRLLLRWSAARARVTSSSNRAYRPVERGTSSDNDVVARRLGFASASGKSGLEPAANAIAGDGIAEFLCDREPEARPVTVFRSHRSLPHFNKECRGRRTTAAADREKFGTRLEGWQDRNNCLRPRELRLQEPWLGVRPTGACGPWTGGEQ